MTTTYDIPKNELMFVLGYIQAINDTIDYSHEFTDLIEKVELNTTAVIGTAKDLLGQFKEICAESDDYSDKHPEAYNPYEGDGNGSLKDAIKLIERLLAKYETA